MKSGKQPTLLVLAASLYQLEVIRTARRISCRVITSDNVSTNPGHRLADRAYSVDITDREGILEIARREKIDGVIAACTDVGVPTAAYVAHHCGLVGPPWPQSRTLTDKVEFRRFLREAGLPVPEHQRLDRTSQLKEVDLGGRSWVIKPDHSSGSKGIFIVDSAAALERLLPETLDFSPTGCAVMEHFLDGVQGTCEGIVRNGRVHSHIVTDRHTVAPPFVATCGHSVPSRIEPCHESELIEQLSEVFTRMGLKDSLFDCDFLVFDNRVYLLEVSPRLGGNSLARLLKESLNFDIVDYAVRLACGNAPALSFNSPPRPTAVLIFGSDSAGRLQYNEEYAQWLRKKEWLRFLGFDYQPGDEVQPFINGRHRVGECLLHGANRDKLDRRITEIKKNLAITTS